MADKNNKGVTELHTFLPIDNSKDSELTEKYQIQVVSKDPEVTSPLSEKPFDPFLERKLENPTTDCDTLIHLLKASLGTGILSMPFAFRNAGLVSGILGTIFVAFICTHCSYILVKCGHVLYRKTRKTQMSFGDVAEQALATGPRWCRGFSKASRYFVQFNLFITYFGTCSAYTVIIAANFGKVIKAYLETNATVLHEIKNVTLNATLNQTSGNITGVMNETIKDMMNETISDNVISQVVPSSLDPRIIIACLLVPLILLTWVPDLKYLAPVSMIANVFMAIGLGITFYYLVQDVPPITDRPLFVSLSDFPKFFSTTIFAMEAIGVVMPLENNMRTPQHFVGLCGVLNRGMSGVTLIYILLGFLGFVKYPFSTNDIVTTDLPSGEILAQIVLVLVGLAVFFTFGLQFYVCLDIGWSEIKHKFTKNPKMANYIMRTIMVVVCVLLAIAVPTIGPFINLIGAFCFSLLGLLAPILLETITYWDIGFGPYKWVAIKNIFIAIIAILTLIFGTKDAIEGIVAVYTKKN